MQYKNTNDGSYTDVITGDSSGTFNDFDEVFENKDITSLSLADATTYRVALKATDNAGNTSEEAYSDDITTDIAKPTDPADIKVNNTSADVSVSADFSLSWTASTDSGSGIKEYSYELKDLSGNSKKSGTATSASTTISISGLSDADYYFYVKVKDYAGNESNSAQSSKITLSTAAPAKPSGISIKYTGKSDTYSYNTNDKYYYVNDATFDASWTGSSSKYEYRIITKKNDDKVKATLVNLTETTLTTVNTSIPSSTTNGTIVYFQVRAKDSAGNTSDYAEQKIKYDKTNIITGDMSLTVPSKISSTSQIDVTFSAKDTESGVWNYAYIISTSSSDPSSGDWDEAYASTSGASGLKSKVDAGNKTPNKKDKTKKTITGLALTDGSTYYLHSRAKNGAGKWSSTKTSGSIKVSKSKQKAKK